MGRTSRTPLHRGEMSARVLRAGNSARCIAATSLLVLLSSVLPITASHYEPPVVDPVLTQSSAPLQDELAKNTLLAPDDADIPPSPAETMRLYRAIAGVVHGWKDAATLTGDGHEPVPTFSSVCITLRLNGQVIGHGQQVEPPLDMPRVGLAPADWKWSLVRSALTSAMEQARPHLPATNDAFADEARRMTAERVMISLELGGEWTPITPATWLDAEALLQPGLDGVAARRGGTLGTAVFPSTMMAVNRLPHIALAGAAAEAIGDGGAAAVVDKPSTFTKQHNVALYRFRTTHLAQAAAGEEPLFLTRGQRVVELSSLNRASLAKAAEQLADHLLARIEEPATTPDRLPHEREMGVRVIGVVEPWSSKAESAKDASFDEKGLMAYALVRYSRLESLGEQRQKELLAAAENLLKSINHGTPNDRLSYEHLSVVLANLCIEDIIWRLRKPNAKVHSDDHPELFRLRYSMPRVAVDKPPLALRAVMVLEKIESFVESTGQEVEHERPWSEIVADLDAETRKLYTDTPGPQLVMHMPWLGWAEQRLAFAKKTAHRGPNTSWKEFEDAPLPEIPAAVALRQMRVQVWEHQLSEIDTGPMSADMAGGIVFTKGQGTPLPTWQTARPAAFFGSMLVDERLTEKDERPLELAKLLQTLRFLRQLQVDESQGWMLADPARAVGGVRAAVWDQSMPLDASSFTLMAYTEAILALDEMAKKSDEGAGSRE